MKKLLILALASAFVAAANAAGDWFKVAVSDSTQITTDASWSTTPAAADVANGVISIDEDVDTALELTPDALSPDAQTNTVVTVQATFTASSDVPEDLTGATTALTVAKENNVDYYFYWDGDSWEKITGVTPTLNTPVTVRIELDNTSMTGTTVTIKVDDGTTVATVATVSTQTKTKVNGLAFAGTGKIGNINADYTKADASYNGNYYATVGGAIAANGGKSDNITLYKHNGAFGTMPTVADKLYFPASVNNDTARLYSFNKDGDDYQIATAADLFALKDAVANVEDMRSLSYKQTANIDMTSADAFAGIGVYADNPTAGTPFTGTYDGGGYTISNVDFTQRNYGGIFNQVNGGTIKNLTVNNITCNGFDASKNDGEWGCAIVGNAGNGAILENLVANGSFGTTSTPCTHNVAGIAIRLSEGNTRIINCTNNATLYGTYSKLGGICALTQYKIDTGAVKFEGCVNNGTIIATKNDNSSKEPGVDGIAGIVAYTAGKTELKDCVNTGSFSSTYSSAAIGELVGKGGVETNGTLTDLGGNKGDATKKLVYNQSKVTGFKYATVDNGVATTVTSLAKDTTYLLEGNVAAGTVFTLAANGDTIAFDTALGYTFGGTVAAGISGRVNETSSSTVTTYTMQQSFTITWKRDADTTIDTTGVYYGETPTHADPTKAGCSFKGWDPAIVAATADRTYTATWEQTAIPVEVATAKTLVSVPQNCKASELIDTSNREKDDMLQVLNKATQKYYQWSYDGEGGWTPNKVATVGDNVVETPEANTIDLVRGEAVWVTRKDASKEILLNAVYTDDPVTVEVIKGYNLVAPLPKAGVGTIAIDEVVADDSTGKDRVFIPAEGKAPYNLDFKDGNWGYDKYTIKEGQLQKVRVKDVAIPAGTGFFYINNGDGKKDITLGGAN